MNGKELIFYSIDACLKSRLINDVVVSTDDEEIKQVAEQYGALVPFLRPRYLSTDEALAVPTISHAVIETEKINNSKYEFIVMIQPTAPLRTSTDIDESLSLLVSKGKDSIISVVDVDNYHPFKMKLIRDKQLYDYEESGIENPPRQSLPKVYIVNGAIYAMKRSVLIEQQSFKGKSCLPYVMPQSRSINIDTMSDIVAAEYYLSEGPKEKSNQSLKKLYENAYRKGKDSFFTFSTEDVTKEVLREISYEGLSVLELGCGTGDTAYSIVKQGAKLVEAYDYSATAIKVAKEKYSDRNLVFKKKSIGDIRGKYDCIIMQEVIEHTDDPFDTIRQVTSHLEEKGHLILTCPSFANLRGTVWMTLQILLEVPMSLTDKHWFIPDDMIEYADKLNLGLEWRTFRHSQSHGEMMLYDMNKRLTKALRDAQLENSQVPLLLNWLEKVGKYMGDEEYNGSKALYHFNKK